MRAEARPASRNSHIDVRVSERRDIRLLASEEGDRTSDKVGDSTSSYSIAWFRDIGCAVSCFPNLCGCQGITASEQYLRLSEIILNS